MSLFGIRKRTKEDDQKEYEEFLDRAREQQKKHWERIISQEQDDEEQIRIRLILLRQETFIQSVKDAANLAVIIKQLDIKYEPTTEQEKQDEQKVVALKRILSNLATFIIDNDDTTSGASLVGHGDE